MKTIKKIIKALDLKEENWKKIDEVPKWIRFPVTDESNFIFYVKGKNHRYKIKVCNYKTMAQENRVWKMKRKR